MAIEVNAAESEKSDSDPNRSWTTSSSSRRCGSKRSTGGSELLPAVVIVDTAPEANGRTTPYARHEVETATREREVRPFYVSSSDGAVVRISSTVGHSLRRGTKSVSYPLDARYRLQFFPPLLRDGVAAETISPG
jgi:hypothetical protein